MSKQCTKPKRKRDDYWFKDKVLLAQAQANGQILHEEELVFLADPGTAEGQATKTVITHNAAYQADDLDAYESNCDELNTAKVDFTANLSYYCLDVLAEIGNVTISRVYYVEGLGHNLFSVEQFCDSKLEVAFPQHTCFIRNLEVVTPEPAKSASSPSSTIVDLDATSASNSQTSPEIQSPVISNNFEEENHGLDVARMNNDPFIGISIPENVSKASSSLDVIPTIVHTTSPNLEHIIKWTKDHPLENIIGELKRPVSTRLQLYEL
nr:putative ribonuclease H-like domain-containing protein [Tanacetum cinerariifolium]